MKNRNVNIDAYRIFLMYGICMLHSITQAGHNRAWIANMFEWCVPGFAFISGWYGVRFTWSKLFRLFLTSVYCVMVFFLFDAAVNGGKIDYSRIYTTAVNQWFLTAYAVMMCLAPLIDIALEKVYLMFKTHDYMGIFKIVSPYLACVFVWSFSCGLPGIRHVMPVATGLTGFSFTTLLGVYIAARLVRFAIESGNPKLLALNRKTVMIPCLVCCLFAASIGMGDYQSPFSLGIAACAFLLFMRLRLCKWLQCILTVLAPSMFSVYLMHSHGLAWNYLATIENGFLKSGVPLVLAYAFTAAVVFGACVVGDLPRRGFALVFMKCMSRKRVSNA